MLGLSRERCSPYGGRLSAMSALALALRYVEAFRGPETRVHQKSRNAESSVASLLARASLRCSNLRVEQPNTQLLL